MNDDTFPLLAVGNVLIVVVIVAFVLFRQFTTRPVSPVAYVWVAVLVVRGLVPDRVTRGAPELALVDPTVAGAAFLVGGLLMSVGFGIWRGATMPVWRDESGQVVRKGDRTTLLLWVATVLVRLVLGAVQNRIDHVPFDVNGLWLGVGVTLAAQQVVLGYRARRIARQEPAAVLVR